MFFLQYKHVYYSQEDQNLCLLRHISIQNSDLRSSNGGFSGYSGVELHGIIYFFYQKRLLKNTFSQPRMFSLFCSFYFQYLCAMLNHSRAVGDKYKRLSGLVFGQSLQHLLFGLFVECRCGFIENHNASRT